MEIGDLVRFNGANLRSASWGEKVSGRGILEEVFDYGEHKVAHIRVKDREYDDRFIFAHLLADKDLIAVMLVCVEEVPI